MRVIPRALKFLSPDQLIVLFNTMLSRLECVEIANVAVNVDKEEVRFLKLVHETGGRIHEQCYSSHCRVCIRRWVIFH